MPADTLNGAPLVLIRTILGLEPDGRDPYLPDRIGRLDLDLAKETV